MIRWFASLPIHRKLIAMALAVSTAALLAAMAGLLAFDVARFRSTSTEGAHVLAQVISENAAAAIVFDDAEAARQMLRSVEGLPVVSRACVYRADGTLLAGYYRSSDLRCPATPVPARSWHAVSSRVPVVRNGREVGAVYVERTLSDLPGRVIATTAAGLFMLLLAGVLAFGLARWMQVLISRPIVQLARAAREIGRGELTEMPPVAAPPDETGELVQAFSDMVRRLMTSNRALTAEVEERRRMQAEREELLSREREASRLKDEFLAAVSHELRTPLNAILGWTQVLASTKPTDEILAKAIASLLRNARAQNRVIEDLLDVSRIITGKLQLTLTAVDLRSAMESAVEVITPVASAKGVHLELIAPALPCVVQGDFDRIRQVLWNLLSNAVKFTSAGGVVSTRLGDEERGYAVSVTDTGMGIAPTFLPHVFERFRQADGSTTREHGGLGLGLAIVKELTELHGGTVRATSPGPGRGATFTITVPRLVGGLSDAASSGDVEDEYARLDGIQVLAVDDNPDALDVLASALSVAGARVRTATSGMQALDQIRRERPSIVLCDLAMPGMDGFDVLRRIRTLDDVRARDVPVLAVTAYASDEYRDRCREAGFQGHVAKPYNTTTLIREIAEVVARV